MTPSPHEWAVVLHLYMAVGEFLCEAVCNGQHITGFPYFLKANDIGIEVDEILDHKVFSGVVIINLRIGEADVEGNEIRCVSFTEGAEGRLTMQVFKTLTIDVNIGEEPISQWVGMVNKEAAVYEATSSALRAGAYGAAVGGAVAPVNINVVVFRWARVIA